MIWTRTTLAMGLAMGLSACAAKVTRKDFDSEVAKIRDEMQTGDRQLGTRIDSTNARMDALEKELTAFRGEYTDTKTQGVYSCRACGAELFRSDTKFESHCGWPSFYSPLAGDTVEYIEDRAFGMKRVEVRCATCGSHLGHVFEGEGYNTPTDQRYCINSISLRLQPDDAGSAGMTKD